MTDKEAVTPYRRIMRELRINNVDPKEQNFRKRVRKDIFEPLEELTAMPGGNFKQTADALATLRQDMLNGKDMAFASPALNTQVEKIRASLRESQKQLGVLIAILSKVLGNMEGILEIKNLIEQLQRLEKAEQTELEKIQALRKKILRDLGLDGM
jgi:hypothetical protein